MVTKKKPPRGVTGQRLAANSNNNHEGEKQNEENMQTLRWNRQADLR